MDVVTESQVQREVRLHLPTVLHEPGDVIVVEIVLAHAGDRICDLDESGEVPARQTVAQVDALDIRRPVAEITGSGIGVHAAALKQIDQELVDRVHVDARFDRVPPSAPRDHVVELQAMLVGEGWTGKGIRQSVAEYVGYADAGSGTVGDGDFIVARPLEAQGVDHTAGNGGIPVRNEDALMNNVRSIGCQ